MELVPSSQSFVETFLKKVDLGKVVRDFEAGCGFAFEMVVESQAGRFLVGDVTDRAGSYRVEIKDKAVILGREIEVPNSYSAFSGVYENFDQVLSGAGRTKDLFVRHVDGQGWVISIPSFNLGRGGGQQYDTIGVIVCPLLQSGEVVRVKKYDDQKRSYVTL